jgi:bifunctional N-acetylglucosamine-1-phosphate-uridyltransferase/glucosamine-1-phosphate-acetyltransferase GlmU-like protein
MNILILAAGEPIQTQSDPYPIWLSEVDGQLMLERQINALARLDPSRIVVCVRKADNEAHHVEGILRMISQKAIVVEVNRPTAGAACTALLAIGKLALDEELVIVSATDHHDVDVVDVIAQLRSSGADGGVLTFESLHPRYSYIRRDDDGQVVEVAEKRPISREASSGFYWLRNAGDFFTALQDMILKGVQVNGRFYVAPALNELILRHKVIRPIRLPKDAYRPVKSAKQLDHYEHLAEEGSGR